MNPAFSNGVPCCGRSLTEPPPLQRSRQDMEAYRITEDAALYYLTFSVVDWLPVFICEEPCLIVTESLNFCHRSKHLRINAFVIMPTHMHAILFDAEFDVERLQRTVVLVSVMVESREARCVAQTH